MRNMKYVSKNNINMKMSNFPSRNARRICKIKDFVIHLYLAELKEHAQQINNALNY